MNKLIYTCLLLAFIGESYAQRIIISGQVKDPKDQALAYSTVLLLNNKGSAMVNYTVTDQSGKFEIRNIQNNDYLLKVSHIGFQSKNILISKDQKSPLNLGEITLEEEEKFLDEVKIEGERIPILIKNDTIEYDALAFKARPNEVVEDMLKRMPGMEVDSDGTIRAQGEEVRRVTVDGKEFFGRDPKMATQNLPADAVSKVQVFDRKSEQAQFSGIDDGVREKTINLELKEDRKSGAFGNNYAGYGTNHRFEGKTNINRFNNGNQLSVLGMANNINQQGFSMGDYMNFSGGAQQMMGGSNIQINFNLNDAAIPLNISGRPGMNGIMTTIAGGLNGNHKIGKKTEVNASYFYSNLDHDLQQDLVRENFMPDGSSFDFEQNSIQQNQTQSHRANVRLEHKIDTANSLLLTANANMSLIEQWRKSNARSFTASGELQNDSEQQVQNNRSNIGANAELLWRHRFSKRGRTLQMGSNFSINQNENEGYLNALNVFFGNNPREQKLVQENENFGLSSTLGANFTYTEPLGRRKYLEANYTVSSTGNEVDQKVFNVLDDERILNEQLTNQFVSNYLYQRGGINFKLSRKDFNLTIGSSFQASSLRGASNNLGFEIDRSFYNFLPAVRLNYTHESINRIALNYETSVQEPNINQLQPIVDNRDPLNINMGNPALQPAFRNNLMLNFNRYNPASFIGFFAFVNASYVSNAITYAQTIDENLVRTTSPENVSNNYSLRGNFNLTFPIRAVKSRVNFRNTLSRNQNINILNDVEQQIFNNTLSSNIRYSFRPSDNFETNLTANIVYQLTDYKFSAIEQAFLNQSYQVEFFWSFLKDSRAELNYNHMIFEGVTSEFDQVIPMMDLSIAKSFLKSKSLEAKITIYNILNQDMGVVQTASNNYWERRVTNNLERYFMLTMTYSLNRQLNMMDRGGRGGGITITNN